MSHLFIEPKTTLLLDGNTVEMSVKDIPHGLHSILTQNEKYLVFMSDDEKYIKINENVHLVSELGSVCCVYPKEADWKGLSHLVSLDTFKRVFKNDHLVLIHTIVTDNSKEEEEKEKNEEKKEEEEQVFYFTDIVDTHPTLKRTPIPQLLLEEEEEILEISNGIIITTPKPQLILVDPLSNAFTHLTLFSLDKSYIPVNLQFLIEEIQLSFILFSIYQSELGYTVYKSHLFHFTHITPKQQDISLFIELCLVVMNQIKCFPRDFFRDVLSSGNFMEECLRSLYVNLKFTKDGQLIKSVGLLADIVEEWFEWDMRVDAEDEQPTVCYEE